MENKFVEKSNKTLSLNDVRESLSRYEKYDDRFLASLMVGYSMDMGTGIATAGGMTVAANNPVGIGVVALGAGMAAVGAGVLTGPKIADELIYRTENKNGEKSESTKNSILPFSQRRAEKYKNNEKIAETFFNKTQDKGPKKEQDKKEVAFGI